MSDAGILALAAMMGRLGDGGRPPFTVDRFEPATPVEPKKARKTHRTNAQKKRRAEKKARRR